QLAGEDYLSRFGGQEFFLRDHGGMLPAAVYLEMARAAAALRGGASVVELSQVVWPQPLLLGGLGGEVRTSLAREAEAFAFTIASGDGAAVHCQGHAAFGTAAEGAATDLAAIRARCGELLDRADCDALLRST